MRFRRNQDFGMTTLELNGAHMDVQVKILSKSGKRERRVWVRSFLKQIRP